MRCIHCLETTTDWNWDHIFPASWYPETTPPNLEKWKVPSCRACNGTYGQMEYDLMIRIGLCLDPSDPKSLGIPQKALRAITPQCGEDDRDKAARLAKRKEILGDSFTGENVPDHGIYPGFENKWDIPKEQLMAVKIPAESIRRLNEKIVKGIFFLEDKRYVEPPFKISFWAVHESGAQHVKEIIEKYGQEYAREPGILVKRAVVPTDGLSSLYFTEIWGQFRMYSSVERDEGVVPQ